MSSDKKPFTPGPWRPVRMSDSGRDKFPFGYEVKFIIDASSDKGSRSAGIYTGFGPEGEANAQLIAAAPELLVVLEDLLVAIQGPLNELNRARDTAIFACMKARGTLDGETKDFFSNAKTTPKLVEVIPPVKKEDS